ncbi:MAG TPA: AraC family transcriptional regulator [Longimicrobiaceae bacterium]|nr:AraC family transcriptional regulator [Longimicrobiaceae bacterium]
MRQRTRSAVPVTMGSPRFRSAATATCLVTEAWFPPGAVLEPHTHERTVFSTMLEGGFESAIAGRSLACTPGSAWTEPAEEKHANYVGRTAARVVIVQPDPAREDVFAPFARLIGEVHLLPGAPVLEDAWRLLRELETADALTPLAIDACVVGMMTAVTRTAFERAHHAPPPPWLLRAREMVHAHAGGRLELAGLAAAVGVHPSHLAHAFRRHFGASLGEYARSLRLRRALERLLTGDQPISRVALDAGYADQSHFTRDCRRVLGMGPAAYRRLRRGGMEGEGGEKGVGGMDMGG